MATIEYRSNREELKTLLRSNAVARLVDSHTANVVWKAGTGYASKAGQVTDRYRAIVFADSVMAKRREAKQNNLIRALG